MRTKSIKRLICIISVIAMLMSVLSGCVVPGEPEEPEEPKETILDSSQVSVQLYTIRGLVTSSVRGDYDAVKALLQELKDMGYTNVEPYDFWGLTGEQWNQMMDELDMNISSLHQGATTTPETIEAQIAWLKAVGLEETYINYGGHTTYAAWETWLQETAKPYVEAMAAAGIKANFHTHNHEFIQLQNEDGTYSSYNVLDEIIKVLGADIELDVHWAARAGADPVATIEKYADNTTLLHMKDLSYVNKSGTSNYTYEELGAGSLDLPAIIKAGKEAGVKYFVVEQDGNYLPAADGVAGQMRSLKQSIDYLQQFMEEGYEYQATLELPEQGTILDTQLSVQLYSIRDQMSGHTGDYDYIKELLTQVRSIGYKNVELYNFWGLTGAQWKEILDEVGLKVSSIHQNVLTNEEQIVTLVENLKAIGLDNIFIASGSFNVYADAAAVIANIDTFRQRLAADDIAVNYHTHNQEFTQIQNEDGTYGQRTALDDILADGAKLELDVHWAARAGRMPQSTVLKYSDSISHLHIKDLSFADNLAFVYEEIGQGALDMDGIVKAGNAADTQYYVVEQDGNYLPDGSLASIAASYEYIKEHWLEETEEPVEPKEPVLDNSQISVQLYTIRGLVTSSVRGNYDAVKGLLQELKDIGYTNVEPYDFWGLTGAQWNQLMDELDMNISSLHQGATTVPETIEAQIAWLKAVGLEETYINYGGHTTYAAWATWLQETAKPYVEAMAAAGIKANFHTHNHEFIQLQNEDGTYSSYNVLDEIIKVLGADIELDVHWAARAGVDPVVAIEKYADNIPILHMKDLSYINRSGTSNYTYEELGAGSLDLPAIIKAGKAAGVKYFVVEQDGNYLPEADGVAGQLRSLKQSFEYLEQFMAEDYEYPATLALPEQGTILDTQLSVQLYSIRNQISGHTGDYDYIKELLTQVRNIGYKNVELYNFWGLTGAQWKEILDEVGLGVSSIHQNVLTNEEQIATLVENLKAIGLDNIFIASGSFNVYADAAAAIANIDTFRQRLAEDDIAVNYHTHNQEFTQILNEDGTYGQRIALDDILADGAKLELDVHWAARAGRMPQSTVLKYGDSISHLHIKDLSFADGLAFVYEEIGQGALDMDGIVRAGNAVGTQYYVVEQDGNYLPGGSLDSIAASYDYIRANWLVTDLRADLQDLYDRYADQDNVEGIYTDESWEQLQNALTAAGQVLANAEATDEQLAAAYNDLRAAVRGLEKAEVVTKSDLQSLHDSLSELNGDAYTRTSFADLQAALDAAQAILDKEAATLREIRDAYNHLMSAHEALVARGDTAVLQILVDVYSKNNEASYTPESWAPFAAALETAQALCTDSSNASVDDVANAVAALNTAAGGLVLAPVDVSVLEYLIGQAEAMLLDADTYIPSKVAELQAVIQESKELLTNPELTQQMVQDQSMKLTDTMAAMVAKGDKTQLTILINAAKETTEALFTPTTWTVMTDALAAAEATAQNENATKADVDEAYNDLAAALRQLEPSANKVGLQTAINLANTIVANIDLYTPESVEGLAAVLANAVAVYDNADATQAEVNAASEALLNATSKVRNKANTAGLLAAVAVADSLDMSLYTSESVETLQRILEDTAAALTIENVTQETVDALQEKLEGNLQEIEKNAAADPDRETAEAAKTAKKQAVSKAVEKTQKYFNLLLPKLKALSQRR